MCAANFITICSRRREIKCRDDIECIYSEIFCAKNSLKRHPYPSSMYQMLPNSIKRFPLTTPGSSRLRLALLKLESFGSKPCSYRVSSLIAGSKETGLRYDHQPGDRQYRIAQQTTLACPAHAEGPPGKDLRDALV